MTSDPKKLEKDRITNLQPVKESYNIVEINMRCIVQMDKEPMHFL